VVLDMWRACFFGFAANGALILDISLIEGIWIGWKTSAMLLPAFGLWVAFELGAGLHFERCAACLSSFGVLRACVLPLTTGLLLLIGFFTCHLRCGLLDC
jgi:hypothetical protein